jgi:tripartite-type tricarboxylate transporter receptor subunit TctC
MTQFDPGGSDRFRSFSTGLNDMTKRSFLAGFAALALLLVSGTSAVRAQSTAPFFAGKTINIVVAAGEGGAYSLYAQLAGEYLRKLIPGNPTVVVQSMPGAGGIKATDFLANVASKDGTSLGMLLDLAAATQVLQPRSVRYDLSKFSVVGSFVTDNPVIMVRADTGVRSFVDLKKKAVIIGASGKGSQTYVHPALLKDVLGANIKIVTGYRGSADISLALERGEVQGQSATWVSWQARHLDWIKQGRIIPIVQVGLKKESGLPSVPLMLELATTDEDRQVLELMSSGSQIGRALFAPPGVPPARMAELRAAFETMVNDPGFREAAVKRKLVVAPTPGAEVQGIIQKVVSYAPEVIARARAVSGVKD